MKESEAILSSKLEQLRPKHNDENIECLKFSVINTTAKRALEVKLTHAAACTGGNSLTQ